MIEKIKRYQRFLLGMLVVICVVTVAIVGVYYVKALRSNLQDNAIQHIMDLTVQHQQAFDNFITEDQMRLHSYTDYFANREGIQPEEAQAQLAMFYELDCICSVMCLNDGWFCSNASEEIRQVDEKALSYYRGFRGSGVRDNFVGIFSNRPKFGYYETFTFKNGHKGLIQKTYERNKVSDTYSLTFYDGRGFSYVLDRNGDILLRSVSMSNERVYDNVFDALADTHNQESEIDAFRESLDANQSGSIIFSGDNGDFVYTYVPMASVEGWYLLSIVPISAITEESEQILLNSQMALGILVFVLVLCVVFVLLIWRTQKEIETKDQAFDYQSQVMKIFSSYLANNSNDVYMMLDHTTNRLEYVSSNVERVLGVEPENILESLQTSDMAADPQATEEYYDKVCSLAPGTSGPLRITKRTNARTGEIKYFVESSYCTEIQGRAKRLVYISDRTREQKNQNDLAQALQIAQAANEAKSSFLSSVSHDIRTPMNAIIGFLALMRDEVDKPDMIIEYNKRIDAASQHLLGLINDVLDMNKIESGSATLSISEMDLAEVIEEINTIIRPQARAKEQTFDIFVSHLQYEHLKADKLRLNQILINLLSNSVKYTPEGGAIQLRVEELPQVLANYSRIRFTVADNGMGMSEEYLKVIFDPFTREETEVAHLIQGTGLGMAITKNLVDLMGGTIHVESELDKGSSFTVELELRIQEREDDPKFWTDHKIAKMIVADDEEEVCLNIEKTMSQTGVTTDYSTDGDRAIQMMRTAREAGNPYDLILLDWKMPNLNGLETARLIRKNYPDNIPILLLTAYDWSEIEDEASEIGIDYFMPKPFFMSTFKDAIRKVKGSMKKADTRSDDAVRDKHILVVDDIETNRLILVKILGTLGAKCDVACNGQEAVNKFEASQPGDYDLILMDVQMPVMDGYTSTRTIRSSSHPSAGEIPIIAMTANAFLDDVQAALESGMDAHIAKPVQIDKLKSTIQQVLDDRAAEQPPKQAKPSDD